MSGEPTPALQSPRAAPWRGRRRAVNPRDARIHVRCTSALRASVEAAANAAGMSFPDYVCAQLGEPSTQRARKRPPPADPALLATLARLLGELGKIGSNHNQLAYTFNADGDAPERAAWENAERNIQAMREALMEALGRAG